MLRQNCSEILTWMVAGEQFTLLLTQVLTALVFAESDIFEADVSS
jgi:hypothetical protein